MTKEREIWLQKRRKSIGASDVGAILEHNGKPLSEFSDAYTIWAQKVLGYQVPETSAMVCGQLAEAGIAYLYEQETGREVIDPGAITVSQSRDYPFLTATLDRITVDNQQNRAPDGCSGNGALELKDMDPADYYLWMACEQQYMWDPITRQKKLCYVAHRDPVEEWKISPPMAHQAQLQMQIYCADLQWGSLCAKFPGRRIAWRDFPRNERFLLWAIPQLDAFWQKVERSEPPQIRHPRTVSVVESVYPTDDGGEVIIDNRTAEMAFEWERIKKEGLRLDKERKLLHAKITSKLGKSTWAHLDDGRWIKWAKTKRGYRKLSIVKYRR